MLRLPWITDLDEHDALLFCRLLLFKVSPKELYALMSYFATTMGFAVALMAQKNRSSDLRPELRKNIIAGE